MLFFLNTDIGLYSSLGEYKLVFLSTIKAQRGLCEDLVHTPLILDTYLCRPNTQVCAGAEWGRAGVLRLLGLQRPQGLQLLFGSWRQTYGTTAGSLGFGEEEVAAIC